MLETTEIDPYVEPIQETLRPSARLIGRILNEPDLIDDPEFALLPNAAFAADERVVEAMRAVRATGTWVDIDSVSNYMRTHRGWASGTSGPGLRAMLKDDSLWVLKFHELVSVVREDYERSELSRRLRSAADHLDKTGDTGGIREMVKTNVINFNPGTPEETWEQISDRAEAGKLANPIGVLHNIPGLREIFPMLQNKRLYTFGAKPKTGKTLLARRMALNIALAGYSVMFCPLEVSKNETAENFLSMLAEVDLSLYGDALTERQIELLARAKVLMKTLKIDLFRNSSIQQMISRIRATRPEAVFIDQLSHIKGFESGRNSRTRELELYLELLQDVASDEALPISVFFQMNPRATGDYHNQVKDTGSVVEKSDVSIVVDRPVDPAAPKSHRIFVPLAIRHGDPTARAAIFQGSTGKILPMNSGGQ